MRRLTIEGAIITRHHVSKHSNQSPRTFWDKFWKDKQGHTILYQRPNIWIIGWAIGELIALFAPWQEVTEVARAAAMALLIVWALMEIFKGTTYFRRTLGLVVLTITIVSTLGRL